MVVLLLVLGGILLLAAGDDDEQTAAPTATEAPPGPGATVEPQVPTGPDAGEALPEAVPPLPSSPVAPVPEGGEASPEDTQAVTELAESLVQAIGEGDDARLAEITCDPLRELLAAEDQPPTEAPLSFDRVEAVVVDGDTASAEVFAATQGSESTALTMEAERTDDVWQACDLD